MTGLASSAFAHHYSRNRGCFLFLRVLRCFTSPRYLHLPYVFRQGRRATTPARFPHSEIPGSQPGYRLPGAYRRFQRPSSAPGAKASTVCPYQLGNLQMMLASTIQISRYGRPRPSPPHPRQRQTGPRRHRNSAGQNPAPRPFPQDPTACPASPPAPPSFRDPPKGDRTELRSPARQPNNQCSTNEPAAPGHSPGKRRWTRSPSGCVPVCSLERR